jgi:hypothetical protein
MPMSRILLRDMGFIAKTARIHPRGVLEKSFPYFLQLFIFHLGA